MSGAQRPRPAALRQVATLQTLADAARPRARHQLVNRFARLENERVRLERERDMWLARQTAVEHKLAKLREQIALLRPLLHDQPAAPPAGRRRSAAKTPETSQTAAPAPARDMAIEY